MATHEQTWIKVNAPVDAGVADLVSVLNAVDGLETLQSCQGDPGGSEGYVYFSYGDWRNLCEFVFQWAGPALKVHFGEDVRLTVEATTADVPMAKLSFKAEATGTLVFALQDFFKGWPFGNTAAV